MTFHATQKCRLSVCARTVTPSAEPASRGANSASRLLLPVAAYLAVPGASGATSGRSRAPAERESISCREGPRGPHGY
jgi:hypothetical protein